MATWHLDESYYLDYDSKSEIQAEAEFQVEDQYTHNLFLSEELVIKTEFSLDVEAAVALDLLPLVPEKFHDSQILRDFIDVVGVEIGTQLTLVREITKLLNLRTIGSVEYLRHLGALIGVIFPPEDETSEEEMRKTLIQAVDWYKVKGTYQSIQILALIQQLTINVWDLYTNDYNTFYEQEWFVGDEDENPSGFGSSYYKSPHFGIEIVLDKVYELSLKYLWKVSYLNNLVLKVEETRPVHTIPHYALLLNPKTDEFGNIVEVDGEIVARTLGTWQYTAKYFDMVGSGEEWSFDEGVYFDQSSESFAKSVVKWVLGTGNYPCGYLGESGASGSDSSDSSGVLGVETPVLSGSIDPNDIIVEDDRIIYQFVVGRVVEQESISELGLYIPGSSDQLVVFSCFPRIDKDSRVELKVKVEVFRESLA